ncbi:MAG: EamA family transporter [Nocardioidaceae bacterium]
MKRRTFGPLLVLGGLVCIQSSTAISQPLLAPLGVAGVAGARFLVGASALALLTRPRLQGRSRTEWLGIIVYGVVMCAMTTAFYNAVARLPLGTAATVVYLGPFCVAVAFIRRRWELVLPIIALAGVALISRPSSHVSVAGIMFGLVAAAAAASYMLFAQRVGHTSPGLDGLCLSMAIAAMLLLPFSVRTLATVDVHQAVLIAVAGLVGVTIGFSLDFSGIRRSTARVTATLYSLEPAVAAVTGAILLSQGLDLPTLVGLVLVVSAGVAAASTAPAAPVRHGPADSELATAPRYLR